MHHSVQQQKDLQQLISNGAVIVDVRTRMEYNMGHIHGSLNIPLPELPEEIARLDKNSTIITCCASGMRSETAKSFLQANGFSSVHNGGGWLSLLNI